MILELCKGAHCVDLGESFQTHIYLQNLTSIQPRTSPLKFAGGRRRGSSSGRWGSMSKSSRPSGGGSAAASPSASGKASSRRPQSGPAAPVPGVSWRWKLSLENRKLGSEETHGEEMPLTPPFRNSNFEKLREARSRL